MEKLRTFTQWLSIVEYNADLSYFFEDEITPTKLAHQMLQRGRLSLINFMIVDRMDMAGMSEDDMYKFIKLKELK